jgi:hypothetical protein
MDEKQEGPAIGQDGPERTEYALTAGEWTEVPGTTYGLAWVMPSPSAEQPATKAWVGESGLVDADGPATVDYVEA